MTIYYSTSYIDQFLVYLFLNRFALDACDSPSLTPALPPPLPGTPQLLTPPMHTPGADHSETSGGDV